MDCARFREAASARLDAEPLGVPETELDEHLRRCPACHGWERRAVALTRRTRIAPADVPDLSADIVADVAAPAARLRRRHYALRWLLALLGIGQLGLAAPGFFGDSMGMSMHLHAAHESAAWNAALAVAFLATAIAPRRAGGLLPVLAGFVVLLGVLSVPDVLSGSVGLARVGTHLVCLAALAVVAMLAHTTDVTPDERLRAALGESGPADATGLREVA